MLFRLDERSLRSTSKSKQTLELTYFETKYIVIDSLWNQHVEETDFSVWGVMYSNMNLTPYDPLFHDRFNFHFHHKSENKNRKGDRYIDLHSFYSTTPLIPGSYWSFKLCNITKKTLLKYPPLKIFFFYIRSFLYICFLLYWNIENEYLRRFSCVLWSWRFNGLQFSRKTQLTEIVFPIPRAGIEPVPLRGYIKGFAHKIATSLRMFS